MRIMLVERSMRLEQGCGVLPSKKSAAFCWRMFAASILTPTRLKVARFSLLLKLIEDESAAGLREYVDRTGTPALPGSMAPLEWATAC